ncbi:MAG TPA: hypothetical protein VGS98_00275 [Thermoanaerobaculia bacterium]|nr:hypothetical protein [Thermoanaerobaculia bacterium]
MTESEGSSGASSSSGGSSGSSGSGSSGTTRRKTAGVRRKSVARRKTTTRRKSPTSARKTTTRRTSRRRTTRQAGLQGLLNDLAKRANRAGETIASLSEEGATAARRTLGAVTATSRKTISRVQKEWDQMDNARRAQFVGALLAALAAAAAGVRKATKK